MAPVVAAAYRSLGVGPRTVETENISRNALARLPRSGLGYSDGAAVLSPKLAELVTSPATSGHAPIGISAFCLEKQMVRFWIIAAVAATVAFQAGAALGQATPTLGTDDG